MSRFPSYHVHPKSRSFVGGVRSVKRGSRVEDNRIRRRVVGEVIARGGFNDLQDALRVNAAMNAQLTHSAPPPSNPTRQGSTMS